jgi:hypothetical protein
VELVRRLGLGFVSALAEDRAKKEAKRAPHSGGNA